MAKTTLKKLSGQWIPEYFVKPRDLVHLKEGKVYKQGIGAEGLGFNFNRYDRLVSKHGTNSGKFNMSDFHQEVVPNRSDIQPGIEIYTGHKVFEGGNGSLFYTIFKNHGRDENGRWSSREVLPSIESFLAKKVYSINNVSDFKKYQNNLIDVIEENIMEPSFMFDLLVLGEEKHKVVPYGKIDLMEATKKGVRVDIDWTLANKMLGFYAVRG